MRFLWEGGFEPHGFLKGKRQSGLATKLSLASPCVVIGEPTSSLDSCESSNGVHRPFWTPTSPTSANTPRCFQSTILISRSGFPSLGGVS
ncbi:hypothetical protein BJX64DRAFT_248416 [Aspergillus heterothallicus]